MIVDANGQRTPLSLDGAGRVIRLPTLAELRGGAKLICGGAFADVKLTPEIRLSEAIAPHLDAHDLGLAVAQLNVAVAAMAGMMSMVIPKFDTIFFPDGAGQMVLADGKVAPLPVAPTHYLGPTPYFHAGHGRRGARGDADPAAVADADRNPRQDLNLCTASGFKT